MTKGYSHLVWVAATATVMLVLGSAPSFAARTCWYNSARHYTGADAPSPKYPVGQYMAGDRSCQKPQPDCRKGYNCCDDHSYAWAIPGDKCPDYLPVPK